MNIRSSQANPKRPFWVWIISGFFLFSGVMNLSMLLLILSGKTGLSPQELADVQRASMAWTLGGFLPLANLAGAVTLFMLRKIAFYIFSGMLAAGLLNSMVQLWLLDGYSQIVSSRGLGHALFGYALTFAVCLYTYRLKNRRILT